MKIMDESMENEDCVVTAAAPPKKKKLKQARLQFPPLTSPAVPRVLSNKRKNMSPSPTTCRSPKIVKITAKENTKEKSSPKATSVNDEATIGSNDARSKTSKAPAEKLTNESLVDVSSARSKRAEDREKSDAATKSARKLGSKDLGKIIPTVLLMRCDRKKDEKPSASKEDESSNEELAKVLEDSEAEDDDAAKDKSDASSDNAGANSDSDSERGISSSDDDTDEQKRSTDVEDGSKSVNGKGVDKTPTSGVKSDGTAMARRKLTPKQLEKKMKSTKRREEREKMKMERQKKREEERMIRRREKEARRLEKKEKEEAEKELKRKEKELKELRKQKENEEKQKEKERRDKAKEEDRRKREEAKEEERRKKEEERLEAERKKQRAASTFVSFFVPKKTETKASEEEKIIHTSNFMPFEVKADMRVAPISRRCLSDSEKRKFDEVCIDKAEETDDLYVTEIKKSRTKIRKSGKTWPAESKDDDVIIIDEDVESGCNIVNQSNTTVEKQHAKLLYFAENRRPPYWGTWRKRSCAVTPRKPFSKDTKWFDYEIDSDEEWEEEEPGESLHGSDDEKDEENPDDDEYDVDNEFMVPHGYLSDEEAQADEDEEDMSPETQKLKLKILGAEFEEERKMKTSRIKPRVIGPIWQRSDNSFPENVPQKLMDFLKARQAWVRETPITLVPIDLNLTNSSESAGASKNQSGTGEDRRGPRKTKVPTEALPELIRLVHGNPYGLGFLIKEFMTFWNRKHRGNEIPLSKSSLHHKIRELAKRMACPEEGPMHLKACWYVSEDTRRAHLGDEQLTLPNCWSYALTPKRKTLTDTPEVIDKPEKEEREKKSAAPLITQYTMKITQEEMKKQLTVKPAQSSSPKPSTSQPKPPKRATLISVPRGEQFPKSSIISAFSRGTASPASAATKNATTIADPPVQTPAKPVLIDLDSDNSV